MMIAINNMYRYLISFFTFIFIIIMLGGGTVNSISDSTNIEPELEHWLKKLNLEEACDLSIENIDMNYQLIIFNQTSTIGKKAYMIIHTNKDLNQTNIMEYGVGTYIPYETNVIFNEEDNMLSIYSFVYHSPMESYWYSTIDDEVADRKIYIDGGTGDELIDISTYSKEEYTVNTFDLSEHLSDMLLDETLIFDPNMNLTWLFDEQEHSLLSKEDIITALQQKKRLLYHGSKYNHSVQFAYPIIGYHKIEDNVYFSIYDQCLDTIRYIPYEEMKHFGTFSSWTSTN